MGSTHPVYLGLGREAEFRERDVGAKHLVTGVLATRIWGLMLKNHLASHLNQSGRKGKEDGTVRPPDYLGTGRRKCLRNTYTN